MRGCTEFNLFNEFMKIAPSGLTEMRVNML